MQVVPPPAIAPFILSLPELPPHAPRGVTELLEAAIFYQCSGDCLRAAAAVSAAEALWRSLRVHMTPADRVALLLAQVSTLLYHQYCAMLCDGF